MKRLLFLVPSSVVLCAMSMTATCAIAQEAPSLPQPIEETVVAQPALLDQLRARTMTAERAWQSGLLTEQGAVMLLERSLGGQDADNRRLSAEIAGLLLERAPQMMAQVEKAEAIPANLSLKRALAEHYVALNDERATRLYEQLIGATPISYDKGLLLESLGHFYRNRGETQKAVQVYLQAQPVFEQAKQGHAATSMLIEAERAYIWARDDESLKHAQSLFVDLMEQNDDFSQTAMWLFIGSLLRDGKTQDVRRLLQTPLMQKLRDTSTGIMISQFLGKSYYIDGDFTKATPYLERAISQYTQGIEHPPGAWVYDAYEQAQSALRLIDRWKQSPVNITPMQVDVTVVPSETKPKPWKQVLEISAFSPISLTIVSDNTQVKARFLEDWQTPDDRMAVTRKLEVEVSTEALSKPFDAMIQVKSVEHPDWKLKIPVFVDIEEAVPGEEDIK